MDRPCHLANKHCPSPFATVTSLPPGKSREEAATEQAGRLAETLTPAWGELSPGTCTSAPQWVHLRPAIDDKGSTLLVSLRHTYNQFVHSRCSPKYQVETVSLRQPPPAVAGCPRMAGWHPCDARHHKLCRPDQRPEALQDCQNASCRHGDHYRPLVHHRAKGSCRACHTLLPRPPVGSRAIIRMQRPRIHPPAETACAARRPRDILNYQINCL